MKPKSTGLLHTCHWPGCKVVVPPRMWGCQAHWFRLPLALRRKVWATFRPGQEVDKNPSQAYLAVADEIQQWIQKFLKTAAAEHL